MSDNLVLRREEILRSHDYVSPHVEAGYRLHGGFLAAGQYASPRTLVRAPAVDVWANTLIASGGRLIDVSRSILPGPTWPNYDQSKLLLENGLDRTFWTLLTTTGILEARGGVLRQAAAPDFQAIIAEDLTGTVTGHLNKGLLWAHGADEAGDPNNPAEGAHDIMWFAVRDMVFERDAYPVPEVARLGRGVSEREMPEIPPDHENVVKFLMNALVIEVRAESFFAHCCRLLRDPDLFVERRREAEHAVEIVERIRLDEAIHVKYLQVFLSELRHSTFRCEDGGVRKGADFIDPIWDRIRGFIQPEGHQDTYAAIELQAAERLNPRAARELLAHFDALETESAIGGVEINAS